MNRRSLFGAVLAIALFLGPRTLHARWMSPAGGRFTTMDSYEGDQAEPQTLNKYTYTSDDPVNHVDPTGLTETLTETGVGNAIRADLAATILFNVGLAYTAIKADAWVDWIHDRNDVYAFTRSHHDSTITQLDFDQLEGRINRGLRRRHLYLHYSFRDAATDLLAEGLFNYKPSW